MSFLAPGVIASSFVRAFTAAFGAIGTKQTTGTTTVAVAYPSGVSAAHVAVAWRCGWTAANVTMDAETGWTRRGSKEGGTGSAADSHTTEISCDTLELVGSESGSVTFDNGASAGGVVGVMIRYSKTGGSWQYAFSSGTDDTHGTDRSVTATTSIALAPGDIISIGIGVDTDDALGETSPAISASGITFNTPTRRGSNSAGSTSGVDGNIVTYEATVTAGSGTVAITFSFTTSVSQCGPIGFLRLRAA